MYILCTSTLIIDLQIGTCVSNKTQSTIIYNIIYYNIHTLFLFSGMHAYVIDDAYL